MTVAVIVERESDAQYLIPWGVDFAAAEHSELLIVVPRRSKGKRSWTPLGRDSQEKNPLTRSVFENLSAEDPTSTVLKGDIATGVESSDLDRVAIETQELVAPDPIREFAEQIESKKISLLILPSRQPVTQGVEGTWHQRMFAHAPCEVAIVRGGLPRTTKPVRILIASDDEDDQDTDTVIKRGCQLARSSQQSSITLLFVRPDDDEVARQIAEKHLEKLARHVTDKNIALNKKIQLADNLIEGIKRQDLEEFDLVMVGTRKRRVLASLSRQGDLFDESATAVAAIRKAVPMTSRIWSRFRSLVRNYVPQIHRELRISLVDRLQTSSNFDFDFLALISLSTLIAALGLVRNSAAVVIGAMLVAPLMTPLVAIGFSLIQGNEKLMRSALKSVLLGFTVAIGIGVVTGLLLRFIAPGLGITAEMSSRGSPNLLDLIVALASGIAAAYAMGRPNLISALPGVAIAAALVPPIATSGLSLALGDLRLFGGSLVLFATNIVAIVLGTAITFWAVGINERSANSDLDKGSRRPSKWPRYGFIGLVILSFFLAAEVNIYNPLDGGNEKSNPVENNADR